MTDFYTILTYRPQCCVAHEEHGGKAKQEEPHVYEMPSYRKQHQESQYE